ncbi:MAG: transposase family protein [Acidobacteria bacterium]|nr:transposase family protein [Acidobacteriota bacterium]
MAARQARSEGSRRRGVRRQRRSRLAERTARVSAVAFARWGRSQGLSGQEAARRLSISPAVLGRWNGRWRADRLGLRPRGRRSVELDRDELRGILSVFALMGPHASVSALRELFPDVPRSALEETLRRARRLMFRRLAWCLHSLRWTRPGTIWAADFTTPPARVDGIYNRVLLVRDLASGMQLLCLPCHGEGAEVLLLALGWLFALYGAPLVLKMDNGSAFISHETRRFLQQAGVLALYSPPETPSYNGSIEAGIGSLEVRVFYESARHDRPGQWTCDDLGAARRQANETARPWGPQRPTPDQAWQSREPIDEGELHTFQSAYDRHRQAECVQRGMAWESCGPRLQASVNRVAISRALIERGFLLVRRRRITPPITARKWRRIA